MEKMTDLQDLLKHEIQDLYSVEEQIIAAMPNMIEKATNPQLKAALKEHLRITETQKARLDELQVAMGKQIEQEGKGLFSRLFKSKMVCKGMEGIIEEGNKILSEEMNSEVMDAAIIASAQKIEHYEICGYGTAKAYARELNMPDVERLLDQTLNEEYDADDRLTALAVGRLNREAEPAIGATSSRGNGSGTAKRGSTSERVPAKEMEMETASDKSRGGRNRTGNTGSNSSRSENAPKGTSARSSSSTGRSSSATRGNTSSASSTRSNTSKSSGKTSGGRGGNSSGRSGSSGRSSGRKS
jgi:ferritin-like metal-binding protein YciE